MKRVSRDTKAEVGVAKGAAGILPQEGKTAVLDHLVSDMTSDALKALSPQARAKLLEQLVSFKTPEAFKALSPQVQAKLLGQLVSFMTPEALRASPVVSIEEKIEVAKRLVSIVEEDKSGREVQ